MAVRSGRDGKQKEVRELLLQLGEIDAERLGEAEKTQKNKLPLGSVRLHRKIGETDGSQRAGQRRGSRAEAVRRDRQNTEALSLSV